MIDEGGDVKQTKLMMERDEKGNFIFKTVSNT